MASMLKNIIWMVLATCCWVAAENASEQRPLAMQECIQMALQHNLDLQIERLSPQMAKYYLKSSYGMYDPDLKFTARRDIENVPGGVDFKKANPERRCCRWQAL